MTEDPPTDDARSPKRLSQEALDALERALRELRQAISSGDFFEAERILERPALAVTVVGDLISEIRRLRTLVKDATACFDGMQEAARGGQQERLIRQLRVRLRAEEKGE